MYIYCDMVSIPLKWYWIACHMVTNCYAFFHLNLQVWERSAFLVSTIFLSNSYHDSLLQQTYGKIIMWSSRYLQEKFKIKLFVWNRLWPKVRCRRVVNFTHCGPVILFVTIPNSQVCFCWKCTKTVFVQMLKAYMKLIWSRCKNQVNFFTKVSRDYSILIPVKFNECVFCYIAPLLMTTLKILETSLLDTSSRRENMKILMINPHCVCLW